jgi:hypothetical protein
MNEFTIAVGRVAKSVAPVTIVPLFLHLAAQSVTEILARDTLGRSDTPLKNRQWTLRR